MRTCSLELANNNAVDVFEAYLMMTARTKNCFTEFRSYK